jgi:2-C-methyl-D-erythritol 2,4-cyclodiphosphate synthase
MIDVRTGLGWDNHRIAAGRPLIVGGIAIPCEFGLDGHSDADVLCHAIADAVLGTLGLPDIGHWFPPGDPACKDINSLRILEKAAALIREQHYELVNIDATLVAEAPKVLPHREAMQREIGTALGLPPERIGIKATTNELLGAIGRREGIAAMAVALIRPAG